MCYPWSDKAGETPPLIFFFWGGVQCGRVEVVFSNLGSVGVTAELRIASNEGRIPGLHVVWQGWGDPAQMPRHAHTKVVECIPAPNVRQNEYSLSLKLISIYNYNLRL